jgi:hypothetical protein
MLAARLVLPLLFSLVAIAAEGIDLGSVWAGEEVRVVGIGDFGYRGSKSGLGQVAQAIGERHRRQPFQLGLTVGDNFYPRGVRSTSDPIWREVWEKEYAPLGIPFFATLGNHDYAGNAQAQIDYERLSKSWRMPARYYTFAAGPVRFFALDTDEGTAKDWRFWRRARPWSTQQETWLREQFTRHRDARWKVVYGHHPIFSDGKHGDTARLISQLLPLLREFQVDLYLAGHDHDLQVHERDGMCFTVIGGGGKNTRSVRRRRAEFVAGRHGFLDLSASHRQLVIRMVAATGEELFSKTIEK